MFHFTAAASNTVPSWNFTPCRNANTMRLPSADVSQLSASSGLMEKFVPYFTSVSNAR